MNHLLLTSRAGSIRPGRRGFTMIEMIMVVMLIGLMTLFAVPMIRDGKPGNVHAAAVILRSDIERAQVMALAHPDQRIGIHFDDDGGGWQLVDADAPTAPLLDEINGNPIAIRLGHGRGQVAHGVLVDHSSLTGNVLVFDALGGLETPGPARQLTLRNESHETILKISSSTGWITIDRVEH